LCDNLNQGIAPVPAKIGNRDDPANNLYRGCSDGMKTYFKNSAKWTPTKTGKPEEAHILERLSFTHKASQTRLVAHAYRGRNMKECLQDFLTSQLMYPGSFILHDCIEVWLKGGNLTAHREAAAKAYARNQKISTKAARTVFAKLEE